MERPADDQELFPDEGTTDLIEAAERKRGRRALRDAPAGVPRAAAADVVVTPGSRRKSRDRSSDIFSANEAPLAVGADQAIERRAPHRKAKVADGEAKAGLVTRGVHVGLEGAQAAVSGMRRVGPWTIAAMALAMALMVVSIYAATRAPQPMPVARLRVDYLNGPQLAEREVRGWLARFPFRDKLAGGEPWMLDQLTAYLKSLPAVAEVYRVEAVHEPQSDGRERLVRTLVLQLRLRQPVMPGQLATGERIWLDQDGRVLPGVMPAPAVRRPMLHGLERGGLEAVRETLAMWRELETRLEPELVTAIHLDDALDGSGTQRGIVLYTRQGTRLIWGRANEERFGVHRPQKINELVRTIRIQGDLRRIAVINVRFGRPFFTLRGNETINATMPGSAPSVIPSAPAGQPSTPRMRSPQAEAPVLPRLAGSSSPRLYASL